MITEVDKTTRRTRKEQAEYVIASVKSLELSPHPTSRLMRMHTVLTGASAITQPDHPDFETALEAERDMQILAFVFDQAADARSDDEFIRLIRNAIKDSLLPQDDRGNSKGRDAQFELFVAAICQSAGMFPVRREEPDVTCSTDGIKFGIAAKRVKNVARIKKHVRKAADQIQKAGFPGIIALDTSVALNRDNDRINTPIPDEVFWPLYHLALNRFISGIHDTVMECVQDKSVCGIVFHDQQVRYQSNDEWSLDTMTMRLRTAQENHHANRLFSVFEDRYLTGLPNMMYFT